MEIRSEKLEVRKANTLLPELRFPEFQNTSEWKSKTLGVLAKCKNKHRKPITSNQRTKGPFPYYGASGIVDFVDDFIFDYPNLLIGEDGAKWGAFERTAFIVEGKYWVNNHAHVFSSADFDLRFIENFLVMLDIAPFVTGAAPPKLTLDSVKRIPIPVPPTISEQQKIADCLGSLDELIAAQRAKLAALQDHKKGLLQQLFPAEGQTTPTLRFPEFDGKKEWVPRTVDDVASILMGNAFKSSDFSEKGIQLVRMGNLYQGSLDLDRSPVFLPSHFEQSSSSFLLKPSDLLMSMTGTVGKTDYGFVVQVSETSGQLLINQRVIKITPKRGFIKEFLLHLFQSAPFLNNLYASAAGTKQANLSTVKLKRLGVPCPMPAEQQKIAHCLSDLDFLITAQTEQIASLQEHKKGLMQQLFPNPELR